MKWLLYTGLGLLMIGIVFNRLIEDAVWPVVLLLTGVGLKVVYISFKLIRNSYRPGIEMIFLITGVFIFFTGLYLSSPANTAIVSFPNVLRLTGVVFKTIFIILFIRKINKE